ncbi:tRNA dihydrouridine synthase [Sporobolomyces koalae]|uniref:tRNA dihydrouridine synthase n=1 Tax=Sporobolomyces koalae TaxID=500713 RepID=UPI00316F4911
MDKPLDLSPQALLNDYEGVNACAPMVRYGKLPFRSVVSQYNCPLVWTPMMLAAEFSRSQTMRDADFSTNGSERGTFFLKERYTNPAAVQEYDDSPEPRGIHSSARKTRKVRGKLIIQFAANDPVHLADAAELARPFVDAIDLNCGCPQKWAYQEGIGCALLRKPELVRELVRATKQRLGWDFPVCVKIRVDSDPSRTEQLVSNILASGADVLTVHGRTRHQSSSGYPVDLAAINFARSCAKGQVPVVANGDVFDMKDVERSRKETGAEGVMSARGLLANPALFSGYEQTPLEAVHSFIQFSTSQSLLFPLFHRHLAYMLESRFTSRKERIYFNSLASYAGVLDYCQDNFAGQPGWGREHIDLLWLASSSRAALRLLTPPGNE